MNPIPLNFEKYIGSPFMKDFKSIPKIDAHIHYNYPRNNLLSLAEDFGFSFLTINTEVPFFPTTKQQQQIATDIRDKNPGMLEFIGTFRTDNFQDDDWLEQAKTDVSEVMNNGAKGIKVWKNIGMDLRDQDGFMIMVNNSRFSSLFSWLAKEGIPVIGHLGEPRNCWLPIKEMTTASDRKYFSNHSEYHMYQHPECPSYEDQIQARDAMLRNHPNLQFIGAHLASLEWSVEKTAQWLDRHPFAAVDLAERINHLQFQSVVDHWKVVSFFETYQDRIIYGTDIIDNGEMSDNEIADELTRRWISEWKFLGTGEALHSTEFTGAFQGLNLPDHILEKIYFHNAKKWYGM